MKKKKRIFFDRFRNSSLWAAFGVWSGKPWRCKWSDVWGFNKFSNARTWISARGAVQCLNNHLTGLLKLESLAFFDKAAEDVVCAINHGSSKDIFKCTNDILKAANNKSSSPKCLRVIDSSTGLPSQGIVQEKKNMSGTFF